MLKKEKVDNPARAREVVASFGKPVFVAQRCALTTDKEDNDLVDTWWFSDNLKEIFDDIFPEVDVHLDDGTDWEEWMRIDYCRSKGIPHGEFFKHWKPFWHVGKWIDCEGYDWAECHHDIWTHNDGSLSRDIAKQKCHAALIQVFLSNECDMEEWWAGSSDDEAFEAYLKDWEKEVA